MRQRLLQQAGGRCAVCGYDRCIINLHFHHVDPRTKSFNMTMASGKSEQAYLAEARKCVLVCANCHGEIEAGLVESPPAQDIASARVLVSHSRPHPASGQMRLDLSETGEAHEHSELDNLS